MIGLGDCRANGTPLQVPNEITNETMCPITLFMYMLNVWEKEEIVQSSLLHSDFLGVKEHATSVEEHCANSRDRYPPRPADIKTRM